MPAEGQLRLITHAYLVFKADMWQWWSFRLTDLCYVQSLSIYVYIHLGIPIFMDTCCNNNYDVKRVPWKHSRTLHFQIYYQAILHVNKIWVGDTSLGFIWHGSLRLLCPLIAVVCECSLFVWFTARMMALEKSWWMLSFDRYLCFLQPIYNIVGASCPIFPCRAEIPR